MPAKSKAQQMAAGTTLSAKRGEKKISELKGVSKSMYQSMTEQQLEEMASTKRKGKLSTNRSLEPCVLCEAKSNGSEGSVSLLKLPSRCVAGYRFGLKFPMSFTSQTASETLKRQRPRGPRGKSRAELVFAE